MEFEVRGRNLNLSESMEELVERRIDFALGRFSGEIRRIDVQLSDLGDTHDGVAKQCRVSVTLQHGGRVRAEGTDEQLRDAIDQAVYRVGRRLGRKLDRSVHPRRSFRLAS